MAAPRRESEHARADSVSKEGKDDRQIISAFGVAMPGSFTDRVEEGAHHALVELALRLAFEASTRLVSPSITRSGCGRGAFSGSSNGLTRSRSMFKRNLRPRGQDPNDVRYDPKPA